MKLRVLFGAFTLVASLALAADGGELRHGLARCASVTDSAERLECFDELAAAATPETPAAEGWRLERDDAEGGAGIRLVVDGAGELVGRRVRAKGRLVVQCSQGRLEANVVTGMAAHAEHNRDDHTVLLRLDDDERFTVRMKPGPEGESLVIPWPVMTVSRLLQHERLYFQFNPQGSRPASTTFPLAGLGAMLRPHLATCGLVENDDGTVDAR